MKNLKDAIKVDFSEKEPCLMKAEIVVPAENVDAEVEKSVKEIAKYAQMPGFRAGKAPKALVKKRFAKNISDELTQNLHVMIYEKLREISTTDIVTMPMPEGDLTPAEGGADYAVTLLMNVAPEIKLPKYKGIKLKKDEAKITKKKIEEEVDRIREMYADYTTIDEVGKKDDMLKISYTSDLEPLEEPNTAYDRFVKADDTWCWLSEPEMIPGVIKALTGTKAGDKKTFTATFPEDFTEPTLSGKKAKFEVTVLEVQRRMPIKSDKEFCKRINMPDMKSFRDQIEQNMLTQENMKAETSLKVEALNKVCDSVTVKALPPALLAQAVQMEFRMTANNLVKSEEDVAAFTKDKEKHQKEAEDKAKKQLTKYFICSKIAEEEKISVTQQEIDESIASMSKAYGHKIEDLKRHLDESGAGDQMHMEMLISKVNDLIIKEADISESKKKEEKKDASKKESPKKEEKKKSK